MMPFRPPLREPQAIAPSLSSLGHGTYYPDNAVSSPVRSASKRPQTTLDRLIMLDIEHGVKPRSELAVTP